ncbi:hypothetical protein vseg_003748 [Gypsophila vaccaria]
MPNSPQNGVNTSLEKRVCDFCGESVALVYCKADRARLCLGCDRGVHKTNPLFTKHTRFQLCDVCDTCPASIYCCTDNSVLCQNCDYDVHVRVDGHDRRPLEGFAGCPSAAEVAAAVGLDGFDFKSVDDGFEAGFEYVEFFGWDAPGFVNLDDLIGSTDESHGFHAMVVPPLPKDRNSSCGQHKQEILRQLCELAKSEPVVNQDSDPHVDHHHQDISSLQHQAQAYGLQEGLAVLRGDEARACSWRSNARIAAVNDDFLSPWLTEIDFEEKALTSDTKPDMCGRASHDATVNNVEVPVAIESTSIPAKVSAREFTAADRVSAVSRYKEKKRTRRFEKHIRYESRKLQAENRIRIKGRFAKTDSRPV